MPTGAFPAKPIQSLAPYARVIGPFLFPCIALTGLLMAKATQIGLRQKRANKAIDSGGHH